MEIYGDKARMIIITWYIDLFSGTNVTQNRIFKTTK
jgi:hypothetical protein